MRIEHIGDATLYLGDCLEILPTLDKVDAIGIEIEEKYFDIACKRIETAYSQPRLFDDLEDDKSDPVEQELGLEEAL